MRKYFLSSILLLILSFNSSAQFYTNDIKEILTLQDTRFLGKNNRLIGFLKSKDRFIVTKTLIALENIGDTNSISAIGDVLVNNQDSLIRMIAAFALGQFQSPLAENYLISSIEKDKFEGARFWAIRSLGRIGSNDALKKVTSIKTNDKELMNAVAVSIAQFGIRKIKSEESINKLCEILKITEDREVRKNISYAFYRIADKKFSRDAKQDIITLTKEPDDLTRMWAFGALGKLGDDSLFKYIFDYWYSEPIWQTKVTMANAMANYKLSTQTFFDTNYLKILVYPVIDRKNTHVSLATLNAIAKLFIDYDKESDVFKNLKPYLLEAVNDDSLPWQIRGEGAKTLSKLFKDEVKDELIKVYKSTENFDLKADVIVSFSSFDDWKIYIEVRDLISEDVQKYNKERNITSGNLISGKELNRLYSAFVEMLDNIKQNIDEENQNTLRLIFSEFLSSHDQYITNVCINALQDSLFLKYREETKQLMLFDYNEFQYPEDLDVMQMFVQTMGDMNIKESVSLLEKNLSSPSYELAKESAGALKKIAGKDYSNQITAPKYRTDFEWDMLEELTNIKYSMIKTNKGEFKIQLFLDEAPFTIMNFFKLARKKFYDGTVFHRVVPNFVIQGGDPSGTGYGGPGYSIRTETGLMNFNEYTVGMASSGKDTEGSQFFITHSPQPHLDGRYTVFGIVIEGRDVVDEIQVGDIIETITFSNE